MSKELREKLEALIKEWRKDAEDNSLDYYAGQYNTSEWCADMLQKVLEETP